MTSDSDNESAMQVDTPQTDTVPRIELFNNSHNLTFNHSNVNVLHGDQHNYNQTSDTIHRIYEWLDAPNASTKFSITCNKLTEGTGEWLIQDKQYIEWKTNGGLLWLQGKAGSGKTFLCTNIIKNLQEANKMVFYHYFDKIDHSSKSMITYAGLVASLLASIGNHKSYNPLLLQDLYEKNQKGHIKISVQIMKSVLFSIMENFSGSTYIVLDAMDECGSLEWHKVSQFIQEFLQLGKVHMLISCRFPQGQKSSLTIACKYTEISLDEMGNIEDIVKHVEIFLNSQSYPDSLRDEIKWTLINGANGQIRWVACQLITIAKIITPNGIKEALKDLPQNLEETYQRALQNIETNKYQRDQAKAILQWIAFSFEPLSIEMATEILATDVGAKTFSPENRIEKLEKIFEKLIDSTLVSINTSYSHQSHLQFAHPSVQEYFLRLGKVENTPFPYLNDQLAHAFIAQCCVLYLLHCGQDKPMDLNFDTLASYAAYFWIEHVKHLAKLEKEISTCILNLIDCEKGPYNDWLQTYEGSARPLCHASGAGAKQLCELLLSNEPAEINLQSGYYGNALNAAAAGGHKSIVMLLLEKGAEINAQSGEYKNALGTSASFGHVNIFKLLLDRGANQVSQTDALIFASEKNHETIVKLLLDRGVDVNACKIALGAAARCQEPNISILELLLNSGADINAKCNRYGNALRGAVVNGNEHVVKFLLERGADPSVKDGVYDNALQAALAQKKDAEGLRDKNKTAIKFFEKYTRIVDAILDTIEKSTFIDNFSHILLWKIALDRGRESIVENLLNKGTVDIDAVYGEFGTPLEAASCSGYEEIVKLLLDKGADVNIQTQPYGKYGYQYSNALQAAVCFGNDITVKLLLERGADANAKGPNFGSALVAASYFKYLNKVELLLQNRADVHACGGEFGRNALHAASNSKCGSQEEGKKIRKLLLQHGATYF